jgi:CheY-like chemotaxis protein
MPQRGTSRGDGRPILIVADDEDVRSILVYLLQSRGHVVVVRSNGADALAYLLQAPPPNLVLLDAHLPLMDGCQLSARICAHEALAEIHIVLMTDVPALDHAYLGEVTLLRKPFRMQQLMSIVAQHA